MIVYLSPNNNAPTLHWVPRVILQAGADRPAPHHAALGVRSARVRPTHVAGRWNGGTGVRMGGTNMCNILEAASNFNISFRLKHTPI